RRRRVVDAGDTAGGLNEPLAVPAHERLDGATPTRVEEAHRERVEQLIREDHAVRRRCLGSFAPLDTDVVAWAVWFKCHVADGRPEAFVAAVGPVEDGLRQGAFAGPRLEDVELRRLAQLLPHIPAPAGDGPAEHRMDRGAGQEVALAPDAPWFAVV